jgi:hypothetical protein
VVIALGVCSTGCGGGTHSSAPPATTVPEALWVGQAKVWLAVHGRDLRDISTSVKSLGEAVTAHDRPRAKAALSQFLVKVGKADGDLPANAFGRDLHAVFVEYAAAGGMIREGILKTDQPTYAAGVDALAAAVAKFGAITTRIGKAR